MKKLALIVLLFGLFAVSAEAGGLKDDKEFKAGLKYYNSRNFKAAVKQFREYVNTRPDPTAYYLIGYALYKLGNFSEADEYFREAYLIDPEFSLEKAGLIKGTLKVLATNKTVEPKQSLAAPETKPPQPAAVVKETPPSKPGAGAPAEQKLKAPGPTPAPQTKAQAAAPASPAVPPMPRPEMKIPDAAFPALVGIAAAFGMVFFAIAIGFYAYVSLCHYFIAKRLNVPAPWTAWIPIVNIWTLVASAGKPAWWLILCLIPVVNVFVFIHLYMCITENLGKNKWLGLLMFAPMLNLIFLGWLAFSKSGQREVSSSF